jgi:hypothetical protein
MLRLSFDFLVEVGIIKINQLCDVCGSNLSLQSYVNDINYKIFKCANSNCGRIQKINSKFDKVMPRVLYYKILRGIFYSVTNISN